MKFNPFASFDQLQPHIINSTCPSIDFLKTPSKFVSSFLNKEVWVMFLDDCLKI